MKCYKVSTEREVIDHKQLPRFPYSTVLVLSVVQWLEKVESPSPPSEHMLKTWFPVSYSGLIRFGNIELPRMFILLIIHGSFCSAVDQRGLVEPPRTPHC